MAIGNKGKSMDQAFIYHQNMENNLEYGKMAKE